MKFACRLPGGDGDSDAVVACGDAYNAGLFEWHEDFESSRDPVRWGAGVAGRTHRVPDFPLVPVAVYIRFAFGGAQVAGMREFGFASFRRREAPGGERDVFWEERDRSLETLCEDGEAEVV